MTRGASKGFRLHIGIFGRRNVGKSSLLNAITRQEVSIVSEEAGTTTDPVEKPMELLPLGPVLFIDTAGIDDVGALGEKRVQKTRRVFDRTDLAVLVTQKGLWNNFEQQVFDELKRREIPTIVVFNKADLKHDDWEIMERLGLQKIRMVKTVAVRGEGIGDFRQALLESVPEEFVNNPTILADLVGPGEMAVLVIPVDKEAPRGRLILPQVQAIRDLLDGDCFCVVVKENHLKTALSRLKQPPRLVVTDSQAFAKVAADTPSNIKMTSFSILFARFRGDLITQVEGAMAVEELRPNDRVLIAEACSHHPIEDDIGRVKIPRWLEQYVGGELHFDHVQGHDFPEDLSGYKLVIHCGSCMHNRRELLCRIMRCREAGVGITNYGLVIAYSLGLFERALEPFEAALEVYRNGTKRNTALVT
ncbi:[FeFe] hydrogenase H-cluster maturation GTPase HydF [Planctomycetota bacterium]